LKIKDTVFHSNIIDYLKYNCFLFYGPNLGKVDELASFLSRKLNITSNLSIDNETLKKDPLYISNYIKSFDLFADQKLIIFSAYNSDNLLKNLDFDNDQVFVNCKLIIKAGELNTKSKLRGTFDNNKSLISIACYDDSEFECRKIIEKKLLNEGLSLENDQIMFLSKLLFGNRFLVNCEIEKIILYLKQNKSISNKSLRKLINTDTSLELEALIYSVISGNMPDFENLLNRAKKNGLNDITILNALTKHFYKILYTKEHYIKTKSYLKAVKSIFPPIFFKLENEFIIQTKIWPKSKVESILGKLLDIDIKLKTGTTKSESLLKFVLLSIIKISNSLKTRVI
jgi:DNA polymerase III subunit delta